MPTTTACLWFDGNAQEAAAFYTSVFPRSATGQVLRYGPGQRGTEGSVMTVAFELDGRSFVAVNGGPEFPFTEAVSFQIDCVDQDEVDYYWSSLCAGGEPGECGWLKDRFGLSWQVIPHRFFELMRELDPDGTQRVMQAVLSMKKLEVAELERVAAAG